MAAVRSPGLFVNLAGKVESLEAAVRRLVDSNTRLVGLLSDVFGLAGNIEGKKGKQEKLEVDDGGKSYVS